MGNLDYPITELVGNCNYPMPGLDGELRLPWTLSNLPINGAVMEDIDTLLFGITEAEDTTTKEISA